MNTQEPKNKNFIILILFMVLGITSAKAFHDINVTDTDQNGTELISEEVASQL